MRKIKFTIGSKSFFKGLNNDLNDTLNKVNEFIESYIPELNVKHRRGIPNPIDEDKLFSMVAEDVNIDLSLLSQLYTLLESISSDIEELTYSLETLFPDASNRIELINLLISLMDESEQFEDHIENVYEYEAIIKAFLERTTREVNLLEHFIDTYFYLRPLKQTSHLESSDIYIDIVKYSADSIHRTGFGIDLAYIVQNVEAEKLAPHNHSITDYVGLYRNYFQIQPKDHQLYFLPIIMNEFEGFTEQMVKWSEVTKYEELVTWLSKNWVITEGRNLISSKSVSDVLLGYKELTNIITNLKN